MLQADTKDQKCLWSKQESLDADFITFMPSRNAFVSDFTSKFEIVDIWPISPAIKIGVKVIWAA